MAGRWAHWRGAIRRHPVRAVAVVVVVALTSVAIAASLDGDSQDVATARDDATSTSTTTTEATTTTSSTTTTTEPTSTTAAPTTTVHPPPPPPTAPPRQIFVVQSHPQGLAAMNADGSGLHLLVEGPFRNLDLAPNRSWLVAVKWTETANQLVTGNADGGGLHVLDTGSWQSPRISPDGTRIIAIELQEAVGPVLTVMNRSGGDRQVIRLPNGLTNNVDWSPDRRKLVVTNSSSSALATYDLSTGAQTVIRPVVGQTSWPVWSPDGALIAFTDGSDLVVISSAGGQDRILTGSFAESPSEPSWDGSGALLFAAGSKVYRVSVDGSNLAPLGPGGLSSPAG